MTDFLNSSFEILKKLIYGASEFLTWLVTPLEALEVFGYTLSPLMIIGFGTFTVVFLMVIIHLFNPIS